MNLRTIKLFLIIVLLVLIFYLFIKIKTNREKFKFVVILTPEMMADNDISEQQNSLCNNEPYSTSNCYSELIKHYTGIFMDKLNQAIDLDGILINNIQMEGANSIDSIFKQLNYIKTFNNSKITKEDISKLDETILPTLMGTTKKIDDITSNTDLLKFKDIDSKGNVDLKLIYYRLFNMMSDNIKIINIKEDNIQTTTTTTTTVSPDELTQRRLNEIKNPKEIKDVFTDSYRESKMMEINEHKSNLLKNIKNFFDEIHTDSDSTGKLNMHPPDAFNKNIDNLIASLKEERVIKPFINKLKDTVETIIDDADRNIKK